MQQEAAKEFIHVQSQETLLVVVSRIPPTEGDLIIEE
jgi:hypothetical protein